MVVPALGGGDIDGATLAAWCRTHLGATPDREILREGYLSTVIGVALDDGRRVVVKVRPAEPRLEGCFAVHQRLWSAGYPCPEPLVGPVPFGDDAVLATAEAFVAGGRDLPSGGRDPGPPARWLARLLAAAPRPSEVPPLRPSPPWTRWRHEEGPLWPRADDYDGDLHDVVGPEWLDRAGAVARARLRAGGAGPDVVGHGDWYPGNLRWEGDDLLVVYDWDSVLVDSEAALVGFAGAVFPVIRAGSESTVAETAAFLAAYQDERGRRFTEAELEVAWAAGLWLRAFDAKKQLVKHGQPRSLDAADAAERMARIGTA